MLQVLLCTATTAENQISTGHTNVGHTQERPGNTQGSQMRATSCRPHPTQVMSPEAIPTEATHIQNMPTHKETKKIKGMADS